MAHKFRLGQRVRLITGRLSRPVGAEVYEVVRLLPESNGEFGYRIKGASEPTERAVREHEIQSASH
jgi:hypothetical protein